MGEAKSKYRQAEGMLQGIAKGLDEILPNGIGFGLVIFEFNGKYSGYVSNSQRKDMIRALRECADNLEKGFDVAPGEPIPGLDTEAN